MRLHLCLLRRPRKNDANEMRADPFYEFGSFGRTGCHSTNLLSPRNLATLEGARIAFIQGGPSGLKVVLVTGPVRVKIHGHLGEVLWKPSWPLRYDRAPIVTSNSGFSDIPLLAEMAKEVRRDTRVGQVASKFRSRVKAVPESVATQIVQVFGNFKQKRQNIARSYLDTMPWRPRQPILERQAAYDNLLLSGALESTACAHRGEEIGRICKCSAVGLIGAFSSLA